MRVAGRAEPRESDGLAVTDVEDLLLRAVYRLAGRLENVTPEEVALAVVGYLDISDRCVYGENPKHALFVELYEPIGRSIAEARGCLDAGTGDEKERGDG